MSWKIDSAHSQVTFSVRHMMISNVYGRFEQFEGDVDFNEADPARSTVDVKIDASTISTRDPQRDGHLKSPDFLTVEKYPYITFKSTLVEMINPEHGRVTGDLTIRDITRPVVLDVEYSGLARSPYGTVSAGFSASTKINRKDWDLTWNFALETGGVLVGDEIKVNIDVELIRQAEVEKVAVA
ncbi:MAG TPA: YceI family protein [Anaerolineales bacterium]